MSREAKLKGKEKWHNFGNVTFEEAAIAMTRLFDTDTAPLDVVVRDSDTGLQRNVRVKSEHRYVIEGLEGNEES